jgi:hypothetical protein
MIEEFEGASNELALSRSSSSAVGAPVTPNSSHNQTHFTSFDLDISSLSDISTHGTKTKVDGTQPTPCLFP